MVVSAVTDTLENYVKRVKSAQRHAYDRTLTRMWCGVNAGEKAHHIQRAKEIEMDPRFYIVKQPPSPNSTPVTFDVNVSSPSQFGLVLRKLWGHHSVYQRPLTATERARVAELFPSDLSPFPKQDKVTWLKRHIVFSKPSVKFIVNQHQAIRQSKGTFTTRDALSIIPVGQRFNFCLTDSYIAITAVNKGPVNWVLSKHMLLAAGSKHVKMAGEIWSKEEGQNARPMLYFNGNSGTFCPSQEQTNAFRNFARSLFPGVSVIDVPWDQ